MQKLEFEIEISTSKEKLWHCLWELENYKKWTNVFCEGSHYKTDIFKQGNSIHLLAPNGGGMYSIIDTLVENKLLIFRHIGELKDFEEQPLDEKSKLWTNALESYELIDKKDSITLKVNVDTAEEYVTYMNNLFPKALMELKKLAEN